MWILLPLTLFIAVALVLVVIGARTRAAARTKLLSRPFEPEWDAILRQNMPQYSHLNSELLTELQGYVKEFIHDKTFEGCGGLEITIEMKVVVAAEACLLLLNRPQRCYPRLTTVLLYPSAYVAGGDNASSSVRLGESWVTGSIVLAWDSVKRGAINVRDGHNVTMHEFAHQLDQEDGVGDGAPILTTRSAYSEWAKVLGHDYEDLREQVQHGDRTVIDDYGATNPAEFFAVATETFFEKPRQLHSKHPELFEALQGYYRVDPREWL